MAVLARTYRSEGDIGLIEIPRRNSTRHLDITELIPRRRVDRRRHSLAARASRLPNEGSRKPPTYGSKGALAPHYCR
jgi:hypothetical protein